MKAYTYIEQYVNSVKAGQPIYINNVYDYLLNNNLEIKKNTFNTFMQRFAKTNNLNRFSKGVYYKSVNTVFGPLSINKEDILVRKYITDGKQIFGYESGLSFLNKIGVTTQIPRETYIVSAKSRYKTSHLANNICLMKPVIDVNKSNYKYLQMLDVLKNKKYVNVTDEEYAKIICEHMIRNELDFRTLVAYASFYNNLDIYRELSKLAQGGMQNDEIAFKQRRDGFLNREDFKRQHNS